MVEKNSVPKKGNPQQLDLFEKKKQAEEDEEEAEEKKAEAGEEEAEAENNEANAENEEAAAKRSEAAAQREMAAAMSETARSLREALAGKKDPSSQNAKTSLKEKSPSLKTPNTIKSSDNSSEGNNGLPLFLGGVIVFILLKITGLIEIYGFIAPLFLLYAGIFVFRKKAALVVIIFSVSYFLLSKTSDISKIIYYIIPIVIIGALIHGLLNKVSKKENLSETIVDELGTGLALIIIFLLDAGLVELLAQQFGFSIPIIFGQFISWVPLWAYVGLYAMVRDEEKETKASQKSSSFLTIAKIIAIIYLVSIIIYVSGEISAAAAAGKSLLPGTEELVKAKKEAEKLLPKTENPAISNLVCLATEMTDVPACVQKRQKESKLTGICKTKGFEEGTDSFEKCKAQEIEEEKKISVVGVEDQTIKKPMKAEFIEGSFFPKELTRSASEELRPNYPLELKIENPRGEPFSVEFKCNFTSKKKEETEAAGVAGIILGLKEGSNEWLIQKEQEKPSLTIVCQPAHSLNGSYTLYYEAKLKGLKTSSRLQRAFLASNLPEKKKESVINDIMKAHFSRSQSHLSQGPADFARINFAFGNPLENPLIEPEKGSLLLASSVENLGKGQIIALKKFKIDLENFNLQSSCLEGENIPVPEQKMYYKESIHLPNCLIKELPPELLPTEDYIYKEFKAELEYDYLIKKEMNIIVQVVS